ncbi:MAG: hypothetical protein QNJ47_26430 [Nostocaceae cyanobacterium]|nr:hypothetical protein [Nostocaceae cyanobacterium]
MLYMKPLTFAAACTFLVSTGLPFLFAKPASAITFNTSISLLESDVLPPWDVPEVGRGNFEFDGSTNTYGNFVIEDLLFLNFGTFGDGPWTTLFPNNHPVPYPPNTRSLLTQDCLYTHSGHLC